MSSCINFSKKYPILLVVLTFFFIWGLSRFTGFLPDGPLHFGIRETIMAVLVFIVTFLFMGKEKVTFSTKGFGYAFRLLRGYFILLAIITVLGILIVVAEYVEGNTDSLFDLVPFINILLVGLFVGIVEEFTFRGLIFGGLLQKFGNSKKGIILAAVISGLMFGVLHIIDYLVDGEITNIGEASTAIMKIVQTGIFGVVLAFIYFKTRNLFAVAALHSLNDLLEFLATSGKDALAGSYVSSDKLPLRIGAYVVFALVLVPNLVKCIRDIKENEPIPFDEDFLPRKVEFVKKSKKKKK